MEKTEKVKIKIELNGLDEVEKCIDRIIEKLEKANVLADTSASKLIKLDI